MSITVTNKEAIEVVTKRSKEQGTQPGETAGFLIVYAGNRLAALAKYQGKKGKLAPKKAKPPAVKEGKAREAKAVKELDKISKILRFQEAKAAKQKKSVAVQESGKAGVAVGTLPTLVFEDAKKPTKTSFSKKFKK